MTASCDLLTVCMRKWGSGTENHVSQLCIHSTWLSWTPVICQVVFQLLEIQQSPKSRGLSSIPRTALPLPSVMHRGGSEVMRTGEEGKITHRSSKLCLTDLKGKHTATWLGRGVRTSVLRSYNPSLPTEHPHPDFVSQCQGLLWPNFFFFFFFRFLHLSHEK